MTPILGSVIAALVLLSLSFAIGLLRAQRKINQIAAKIDGFGDEIDTLTDEFDALGANVGARLAPPPVSMPLTIAQIESPMESLFPTDPASTGGMSVIEGEFTPDPNPPTVMLPPIRVTTPTPAPAPAPASPPAWVKPSPRPRLASDLVRRYWAEYEKGKGE